jgi:hypothetical protein
MKGIAKLLCLVAALTLAALAATSVLVAGAAAAPPGHEKKGPGGKETVEVECEGLGKLTVSAPRPEKSNGAAQVVGQKLHGIPVSFSFAATDVSKGIVLFEESRESGHGHGHPNQTTTACKGTFESTAAEFFEEAEEALPEGVAPTDLIRATFEAQVIVKK